jgi:hypothetical protein
VNYPVCGQTNWPSPQLYPRPGAPPFRPVLAEGGGFSHALLRTHRIMSPYALGKEAGFSKHETCTSSPSNCYQRATLLNTPQTRHVASNLVLKWDTLGLQE